VILNKKLFALGRLKNGEMNATEARYEKHLKTRMQSGEVVWYSFEGMKFRLADKTFFLPDFVVQLASGEVELHEVKGAKAIFMDDAKVKIKVASEAFPFRFIAAFPKKNGWEFVEY
jgi:hypothetical protein